MKQLPYYRKEAASYARRWALGRNPMYYDFSDIGGDCTNFVSQCVYAGAKIMNYTPLVGWFYRSANDRTPSWTGVSYLYEFLTSNQSVGPYGRLVSLRELSVGDVIQLGNEDGVFYHSLLVLSEYPNILVAAHSGDAVSKPLSAYRFAVSRCIHIDGVRTW